MDEVVVLDFTNCHDWYEIHEEIRVKFDFPEGYGKNLDALWDFLVYYTDEPMQIKLIGIGTLTKEYQAYMEKIIDIFRRVEKETPNMVFERIS